jgi:flagellar motor protein MotB
MKLNRIVKLGTAALVAWSAGCVPLTDYQALEKRFGEQEQYVLEHKAQTRELERREQVLTMRTREQQEQIGLLQTRLEKSETLRQRLEGETAAAPATLPASAPREEQQSVMGLEVNPQTQGLMLENGVLFSPGRAELKAEGNAVLDRLVTELNADRYHGSKIRIDGHTDDAPIQRSADRNSSNWDLSGRRALAVLHYLESHGIDSERLSFSGFGPHRPVQPGSDNSARARNRRVEVVLFD